MKPTVERLTEQFTQLIGPEAFAKAEAAIAAAKAAEAAAAAAKAAAVIKAAEAAKAAAATAPAKPVAEAAGLREPGKAPGSTTPATTAAGSPAPTPLGSNVGGVPPPRSAATSAPNLRGEGTPPTSTSVSAGATRPAAAPASVGPALVGPQGGPKPALPAAVTPAPRPAPAAPAPAPAPTPSMPVQSVAHAAKGYDFDASVAPNQIVQAVELLDRAGFALDTITGVDWIAQNEMEVVYDFFHPTEALRVVVRTRVSRLTPELPSIAPIFPGANWHERETHDFFGIRFTGHPNLKPFLLPEDADFHPLRKDYKP